MRHRGAIESLDGVAAMPNGGFIPRCSLKHLRQMRTLDGFYNVFALCDILARFAVSIWEGIIDPFLIQQQIDNVNPPF